MVFPYSRSRSESKSFNKYPSIAGKRRCVVEPLERRDLLAADVLFADSFESGASSNDWSSAWVEDSQNDWFRSTQRATDGGYSAEVDGWATNATLTLVDSLDLSGYVSAELTYDWLIESGFDGGEYLSLDVSSDGGATWQTDVRRLSGNVDSENTWHSETVDLTPYASAEVVVRFRAYVSRSNEDANVDNVQITATAPTGPPEISSSDASVTEGDANIRYIDEFIVADSGGMSAARGIEVGPDGALYIGSSSRQTDPEETGAVLRYDSASGAFLDVFATHASMRGAKDVEFGSDGLLYVTDNRGSSVYRFDGTTGAFVDVFVPSGSGGLDTPRQLIFGPDGSGDGIEDLYISSAKTDSILRYDGATGAFLDAFVPAGSGGLNNPTAITFGPDGSLLVASGAHQDFYNTIYRYDGSSGAFLDVFVESGTAGLTLAPTAGMIFGPDVNSDGAQDLYVSNGEVDEILVFSGADGAFLETFVGSGEGGLDDPKGLLFDDDGNLLVVGNSGSAVRRYGPSSQALFTVSLSHSTDQPVTVDFSTADSSALAGDDYEATSGTLVFEPGVASRSILVPTIDDSEAEPTESFAVSLSNPTAATILNGNAVGTILDEDPASQPPQITVSDTQVVEGDQEIRFIDDFVAAESVYPEYIAFGPDSNLYVVGVISDSVLRFDAETGSLIDSFVEPGSGGLERPFGIVFGPDGNGDGVDDLYLSDRMDAAGTGRILRYDGVTGDFDGVFVALGTGGLNKPNGFVFGPDGDLYVTSRDTDEILRYDGDSGAFLDAFVTQGSGGLDGPIALTFGEHDGNLYVTASDGVLRFDGATGTFIDEFVAAQSGGLDRPLYLEFGPDGHLYVTSSLTDAILRYDVDTGDFIDEYLAAPTGNLDNPSGFIFGDDGNFYVSNRGNSGCCEVLGSVKRFGPSSQAVFTVSLSHSTDQPVTVDFSTADGTALAGDDYEATSGTLVFDAGVTTRTIIVPTIDDELPEDFETFDVTLSNPSGATVADGQSIGTIADDGDVGNQAPIVDAGPDQTSGDGDGSGDQTVTLNGTATDGDGIIESYEWTEGATLLGNSPSISPTLSTGVHTLTLTVTDNEGATGSDTVVITVNPNQGPTAVAGVDQMVTDADGNGSEVVTLTGSGTDSDGSIVTYEWKEGTTVLGTTASISPQLSIGVHTLTLTVTDNGGLTSSDAVTVTIDEALSGPNLSHGNIASVDETWQTVPLSKSYTSMVVVATPRYDSGSGPGVVRVRNVTANSFEVRVDNVGSTSFSGGVHYIAVEEGVYDEPGQYKLEAVMYTESQTSRKSGWVIDTASQGYQQAYNNPVVVGQVMSANDADWSVFWASSGSRTSPPSSSALNVGKHIAEDTDTSRVAETIGYLVIEATQNGSIEGLPFVAGVGSDTVRGVGNGTYHYDYDAMPNAKTAILASAGMDGGDGGWPVLRGTNPLPPVDGSISLSIDEDQLRDSERNHTTEQVAYLVIDPPLPEAIEPPAAINLAFRSFSIVADPVSTSDRNDRFSDAWRTPLKPQIVALAAELVRLAPTTDAPKGRESERTSTQLEALDELFSNSTEVERFEVEGVWDQLL